MDVDPCAGLLPEGLNNAAVLADDAAGLGIRAQDAEEGGDSGRAVGAVLQLGGRGEGGRGGECGRGRRRRW